MSVLVLPHEHSLAPIAVRDFPDESAALAYAVEQWRAHGGARFTVYVEG